VKTIVILGLGLMITTGALAQSVSERAAFTAGSEGNVVRGKQVASLRFDENAPISRMPGKHRASGYVCGAGSGNARTAYCNDDQPCCWAYQTNSYYCCWPNTICDGHGGCDNPTRRSPSYQRHPNQ
jgi:hypothetical protein